jgi:hypothetical protein
MIKLVRRILDTGYVRGGAGAGGIIYQEEQKGLYLYVGDGGILSHDS